MNNPRIAIAGGGPAGATLGAILAKEGMNVVLYEKARFPRHHVGEALQPAAFELLDFHLGMGKVFTEQGFAKKFGALYLWGDSRDCWSVLFDDRLEEELEDLTNETLMAGSFDHSWQVDRATFDKIHLDEAERRGVEVHQDMEVVSPVLEGERVVGLEVRDKEGNLSTVNADLVVDATGQRCLLGRYFKTTEDLPDLQATATYAYMDGLGGVDSALSRNVQLVVTIPDGWVWWIPISDERTSVGVVTHRKRKLSEEEFLQMISDIGMPVEGGSLVADASGATLSKCLGPSRL